MRVSAALLLCLVPFAAQAKPTRHAPPAPEFSGDRWVRVSQAGTTDDKKLNRRATAAHRKPVHAGKWRGRHKGQPRPERYPVPGVVSPLKPIARASSVSLAGVVAPLAAKAREIVASCGSTIISGVRHTYIAGTGGRLSLHASGRAVDITGNPSCIYSHLRGSSFGYSTDYGSVRCRGVPCPHVHVDTGGRIFTHSGGRRHKHRRRA